MFALKELMLGMVFLGCIRSILSVNNGKFPEKLHNIFLRQNLSLEDSKTIFANAKRSYATLRDVQVIVKDPTSQEHSLKRMKIFLSNIVRDLERDGMSLFQIFDNINTYLEDEDVRPVTDAAADTETLRDVVEEVTRALEEKLGQYYEMSGRRRHDIHRILSHNTSFENSFREDSGIDASAVGFFFLEVFATLIGLSWGIVSMILAGPQ